MSLRQRQGAQLFNAGPGARLPDEAFHGRRGAPLAGDGRRPVAGTQTVRPRPPAGNCAGPHHDAFSDANFQETIATANNRPPNDANDAFIGYDQGNGDPTQVGVSFGAPKSLSSYIGNAGNGTSWLERLTATLKEFKTNVQMDSGLTLAGSVQTGGYGHWKAAFGTMTAAGSSKSKLGFGASGKLQVSENGGTVFEVRSSTVAATSPPMPTLRHNWRQHRPSAAEVSPLESRPTEMLIAVRRMLFSWLRRLRPAVLRTLEFSGSTPHAIALR